MERRLKGFIWIGLGISLLLALFLSPFASSSPDGLEKVAEMKGFSEKGEGRKLWQYAPFSEYAIPWIKNEKVSTALSGLIGTLAIFFVAMGIGKLIRRSTAQKVIFLVFLAISLSWPAFASRPLTTDEAYTIEERKTLNLLLNRSLYKISIRPKTRRQRGEIGKRIHQYSFLWPSHLQDQASED
jgi:cobalt/nickel transport protein